ncbi:J domain-containing protein [bacterium]|nr:J domain-containing protein [bacterium]
MATKKSYYEILEIKPSASAVEIKRAFYRLSKKYHPDVNPKTADLFKQINEAYQTLSDTQSRAEYDRKMNAAADDNDDSYEYDSGYSSDYDNDAPSNRYSSLDGDEPIINILDSFSKYKFEDAVSAIWHRNVFVLLGTGLWCTVAFLGVLADRLTRHRKTPHKPSDNPWIQWLKDTIVENKLYPLWIWCVFLLAIFAVKVVYHIIQAIVWIFVHIVRPLLIALGLLILADALSGARRRD